MATEERKSYIDFATFTSPIFSPTSYANTLVLQTNNPSDTPLDLSTPLSRVLFDAQEIDTHIDTLTTTHALPLIEYTRTRSEASEHILQTVEEQLRNLTESYTTLEKEVIKRHEAADQVRFVAERMLRTLRLGRTVQRVVTGARQLQAHMNELNPQSSTGSGAGAGAGSGFAATAAQYRAMVPAAKELLSLRQILAQRDEDDGNGGGGAAALSKVQVVGHLRQEIVAPAERTLLARAQQTVREFSMSNLTSASSGVGSTGDNSPAGQTYAQTEDAKSKIASALQTLYLLSPFPGVNSKSALPTKTMAFAPTLLLSALQTYLQTALTASVAALSRALATLPTLDRALLEIAARCQNIVALEALLASTGPPVHPLLGEGLDGRQNADKRDDVDGCLEEMPATPALDGSSEDNFLGPLLRHLDTPSLPSYFWRTMAGQLNGRVQDILVRGGVSARTLRSNRDRVRDGIRECVDRGSQMPTSGLSGKKERRIGNFEREAAVMVQSVVGPLSR